MKKVLITGAEGFIATNLILRLSNYHKDFLRLSGVDSGVGNSQNLSITSTLIEHNKFDLRDTDQLIDLMRHGCDLVIHLAANGNVIESVNDPIYNMECNVLGTISLLEAMRHTGVKRLIFSSTGGALMGNTPPPVNEQSLPKPISPYGASKMACEGYINAYAESYDISSVIFRFGNVYGPHSSHKKGVLNAWISKIDLDEEITIYGSGDSTRDYINVGDVCQGIVLGAERLLNNSNTAKVEVYHLSNNQEISLRILADVLQASYPNRQLKVVYQQERTGEVKHNKAEFDKARKLLGFNPQVSLADGIKQMLCWHHGHRD